KPVRCGLLPSYLDLDILHPLLLFVILDYSSQDCGSVPNLPNSSLCENSDLLWTVLLDKHSGSPNSQWYDSPVYLCSVIKVS
ncbi:hypothetical protein CHARACLAT_010473, partial [Characodon lateralis]|nr:hypothetical protein [Characodon lateralis]